MQAVPTLVCRAPACPRRYPHKPAVVLMNSYRWYGSDRACTQRWDELGDFDSDSGGFDKPFTEIAGHYSIPVLSTRLCCHSLMKQGGFVIGWGRALETGCSRLSSSSRVGSVIGRALETRFKPNGRPSLSSRVGL
jgi:hypothetical protein